MKTIIFGHGFCGSRLSSILENSSSTEIPEKCPTNLIPFDFNDSDTWSNLPDFDSAIITFKMENLSQSEKLANLLKDRKVIILSSARNLKNITPAQTIDENTPLADNQRVKCESFFEKHAVILYLGLIWGVNRHPKKWLEEGRIKNGKKIINMIHVEDICHIVKRLLNSDIKSGKYLISDGHPLEWNELAEYYNVKLNQTNPGVESRKFNTKKLQAILPEDYNFKKPF